MVAFSASYDLGNGALLSYYDPCHRSRGTQGNNLRIESIRNIYHPMAIVRSIISVNLN